jgi:hypothetical protein
MSCDRQPYRETLDCPLARKADGLSFGTSGNHERPVTREWRSLNLAVPNLPVVTSAQKKGPSSGAMGGEAGANRGRPLGKGIGKT